jgi:hypothetical protein
VVLELMRGGADVKRAATHFATQGLNVASSSSDRADNHAVYQISSEITQKIDFQVNLRPLSGLRHLLVDLAGGPLSEGYLEFKNTHSTTLSPKP